jgi:hypothetical protein
MFAELSAYTDCSEDVVACFALWRLPGGRTGSGGPGRIVFSTASSESLRVKLQRPVDGD